MIHSLRGIWKCSFSSCQPGNQEHLHHVSPLHPAHRNGPSSRYKTYPLVRKISFPSLSLGIVSRRGSTLMKHEWIWACSILANHPAMWCITPFVLIEVTMVGTCDSTGKMCNDSFPTLHTWKSHFPRDSNMTSWRDTYLSTTFGMECVIFSSHLGLCSKRAQGSK